MNLELEPTRVSANQVGVVCIGTAIVQTFFGDYSFLSIIGLICTGAVLIVCANLRFRKKRKEEEK